MPIYDCDKYLLHAKCFWDTWWILPVWSESVYKIKQKNDFSKWCISFNFWQLITAINLPSVTFNFRSGQYLYGRLSTLGTLTGVCIVQIVCYKAVQPTIVVTKSGALVHITPGSCKLGILGDFKESSQIKSTNINLLVCAEF